MLASLVIFSAAAGVVLWAAYDMKRLELLNSNDPYQDADLWGL
jgi:hypothetical protein